MEQHEPDETLLQLFRFVSVISVYCRTTIDDRLAAILDHVQLEVMTTVDVHHVVM